MVIVMIAISFLVDIIIRVPLTTLLFISFKGPRLGLAVVGGEPWRGRLLPE